MASNDILAQDEVKKGEKKSFLTNHENKSGSLLHYILIYRNMSACSLTCSQGVIINSFEVLY